MAFGKFIKKIFSFGSKKVEEEPAEGEVQQDAVEQLPSPVEPALRQAQGEEELEAQREEVVPEPEPDAVIGEDDDEARQEIAAQIPTAASEDTAPASGDDDLADAPAEAAVKPQEEETQAEVPDEEGVGSHDEPDDVEPEPILRQAQDEEEVGVQDGAPAESLDEVEAHEEREADVPNEKEVVAPVEAPLDAPAEVPVEAKDDEPADAVEAVEQEPTEPQTSRDETRGSVTIGDEATPEVVAEPEPEKKGWFARLTSGLSRSSKQLTDNITGVFTKRKLDDETLEELEDILIQADLGVETAMRITDSLSSGRYGKDVSTDEVRSVMAEEITKVLDPVAQALELDLSYKPHVILVVGVNGTGKTTTIGKLAAKLRDAGLKVTLGAGDTFRAAAIEQLKIWADRTGSTFVGTKLGADAAGLAYGAYETARDNGSDVVIIDTAGRLQNKTELMDELAKIVRVLQKHDADAPHTVLQTLDATTGQNAMSQVEIFRNVAGVNGLVMTKLDGTARGGILVAIAAKFKLPVYFIGVGEGIDDLEPFRATDFSSAIVGTGLETEA